MKSTLRVVLFCIFAWLFVMPSFAAVTVVSPANGAAVGASAQFTANAATASCGQGVASMGVYIDNQLAYVENGAALNHSISLSVGTHSIYIQEWDYCGGSTGTALRIISSTQSGVTVASPADNSTVSASAGIVASATTGCAAGVSAMGVYVNNQLAGISQGASFNKQVALSPGTDQVTVQSWDGCGGSAKQPLTLNVQGNTLSGVQTVANWNQWGELPPVYAVCSPCTGVTWKMTQHEQAVSLSGNASRFDVGGSVAYSDVLWSNKLIGQGSTLNLPDTGETVLPNVHYLTYNADVFVTDWSVTQALEFDMNMYMGGVGMEWGNECNHLADGDWDVWDNVNAEWISTGAPCSMNNNAWNHVTIQVERLSDNSLLYQTITVNGTSYIINKTFPPFTVPSGWYGMTVNYQMDGNYRMAANTTYLDNLDVTYW